MENKTPSEELANKPNKEQQKNSKNPICVMTYKALPRIYGKKSDSARAKTQAPRSNKKHEVNRPVQNRRYFTQNQERRKSSFTNKTKSRVRLSEPKNASCCSKKACSCHIQQTLLNKRQPNLNLVKTMSNIRLPEIQKFQLVDLQSQHKVLERGLTTQYNFKKTGLQTIIEQQNEKTVSLKNSPPRRISTENIRDPIKIKQLKRINFEVMKSRHKYKTKINEARSQIFEDSNEVSDSQQSMSKASGGHTYGYQTQKIRKFSQSFSISNCLKSKRQQIANGAKTMQKWINNHNRLLRIPQQQEYYEFIKGYASMNKQFNLLSMVKNKGFTILKDDNQIYFGQSDDNANMHGFGLLITNKNIFQGKFNHNLIVQGYERNIDGTFVGKFSNRLRTGHGVFFWNNGQVFEGDWQNGKKNGYGVWRSPNGDQYEGEWFDNRQHGKGTFKARRSTYTGEFKNFLKHGHGHEIFQNGDSYNGEYKHGKPFGKGRYQWSQGGYYEGDFVEGMREGKGVWVDPRGNKYEGSFMADFKHGFGKQITPQGYIFEGQFFRGERVKTNFMRNSKQYP